MRIPEIRWLGMALLAAACAGTAVAGQESSQSSQPPPPEGDSLAEAARKAKGAKAKPRARRVYTEDDLLGLKKGTISTVGEEPVAAPAEAEDSTAPAEAALLPGPGAPGAPGAEDETYWREKYGKLRNDMTDVDQQIEKLKEEIKEGRGVVFDTQSGLHQGVIYYEDLKVRVVRLEERKKELQKQMDALRDEARKAGVPPGWLR